MGASESTSMLASSVALEVNVSKLSFWSSRFMCTLDWTVRNLDQGSTKRSWMALEILVIEWSAAEEGTT